MSLNDPNWGRGSRGPQGPGGGNQGPPDLDELWRNFNRRLGELFGRRRRGGDEPPPPPSSWQIGGGAVANYDPAVKKDGQLLSSGSISLQAESHPCEYRKIEILKLK